MGVGSTNRQKYYLALGLIYLAVGILPIGLFPQTSDCPVLCALRFPDRKWKNWECTESIGDPVTNYLDIDEYKRIYLQFYLNATGPCYVCAASNSTTLLEPCKPCPAAKMSEGGVAWKSNDPRYSKLSSCATPGSLSECATATVPNYKAAEQDKANDKFCLEDNSCSLNQNNILAFRTKFLPEPDINLRGIQPMIMILIAGIYLIQAIGCIVTGCCLENFKDRYGDGWLKISTCDKCCRGCCIRAFPKINRILNIFALFFIVAMIISLWVNNTCADALNMFSENVLYGTLSVWLIFAVVQYVLLCIGGTYFRTLYPEDLPFREPPVAIDRGNNAPTCCCFCLCGCCGYGATIMQRQQWSISLRLCCASFKKLLNLFGP